MATIVTDRLSDAFAALDAERQRSWPPEKLAANRAQRRALVAAFDPAAVVRAGDRVSSFTLERADDGSAIGSDGLLANGPAVLIFFRFAGCPACNIALPHYDRALAEPAARLGARIVAVSPHLPETGADAIRARHGLRLAVASDRGNRLARRFGLAFVPADAPPPPADDPAWIGALTGTGTFELPMPAVIVLDPGGTVRFADVSPDWLARTEPAAAVAALSG